MTKIHITHVDAVFGQIVVAERMEQGLGQAAFAHKLGLHPPALSRLERGESPINIAMVVKIARELNTTPRKLFQAFDEALDALAKEKVNIVDKKEITKDKSGLALALLGGAAIAFLISR